MGFNLADVGLVSTGWNASADAERARQMAEEDRLYQLEQRRQKQEQAAAAQAEFQRQQAFQSEARQIVPKFLSGGDQALPAQPGTSVEVPQLQQVDEEGNAMPAAVRDVPGKPARDNLSGMYDALQKVALKHGRVADYETMKGHAQKLQEEGVLDFVRAARRGADEGELLDAFNKTGKVRLSKLSKVGTDQYAGLTEDGKPVSFDLNQITESLLAPKDYLAHKDKTEIQQVRRELGQAATEAKNTATQSRLEAALAKLQAGGDVQAARAELDRAKAELARSKADGGGTVRNPGNWNVFDAQVRTHARDSLTETDPDTGKKVIDHKNLATLSSRASALARAYPDVYTSAADAVAGAMEHMDEVKRIQTGATDQATEEAKTVGGNSKWIKSRADSLARMRQSATAAPPRPGAMAPTPAPAPRAAASSDIAEPATQEDFDKLAKGARYKNPSDGKTYVKN